ncbi:EAL domain-containing protein [Comamonas granuli]|uniref:EAL domain-containing protein n=1 Tax=Comamonas granuli TaxID=290309 RepID=UPI000694F7F2|nr:EAL domain-containing protein [Comamonas granuli]
MPIPFNVQFGQDLCDVLHAELGLVCSFMDASGRIVASSARARIGQHHAIALRIMQGEMDEYCVTAAQAAHSDTMREGIGMVIQAGGQRLTCFALAGPLAVVQPLARIVRFCVTALLQVWGDESPAPPQSPPPAAPASAPADRLNELLHFASQKVEFSLARLHEAVNYIDQGLSLFDRDMRLVVWNRQFLQIIGWPTGQPCHGQPMDALLHSYMRHTGVAPQQLQPLVQRRVQRLRTGQSNAFEYTSAQGQVLAVTDRRLPDGSVVSTYTDVTERHQAENALRAAHEHAERLLAQVREHGTELSRQLGFMQQLIEAIPGPLFYKDAQARYLGCNSAFEAFIGKRSAEIIGRSPLDLSPPALAQRYMAADRELLDRPGKQIYESRVQQADGQVRDVIFHKATFTNPDGSVGGLVGVILDITERKRMEDDLRQAATFFDNSAEGVTIAQHDGTIIAVNRAFTAITGYEPAEVIGRNPRLLQSGRHDQRFYAEMWEALARHGRWQGEVWNRRKSGDIYPQWLSIVAVRAPQGPVTHYVATFSDITQQKENEERIQQLAFSDPLTGLPNRRLLLDRLEHAIAVSQRNQRHGALFFIDIDHFKGLNDTRGHYVGDLLLQQVAQRLTQCVNAGDTVARLGGDEFVVMLEGLSADALQAVAQAEAMGSRLLQALGEPYTLHGSTHHHSASMGVALFGTPQTSVEDLLRQADMAMYRAKASGRNALSFFDPQMQSALVERVALEKAMRQALEQQAFLLHYQPQVHLSGAVVGVEALLRWRQADGRMVSPAEFIPLAEDTGLILPLGRWVLETACRQLSTWAQQPRRRHLSMTVNVSARQFHHGGFVDEVLEVLEHTGADPRRLKLELTESLLVTNVEDVVVKMVALKARGVGFSLDDFGTGYSSLAYLKRLPLDRLKIDQGFVRNVLTDANDAAIARTVVALSDSLGLEVIAEGVEQAGQRDFLAQHGCHTYQGYFFSRPLAIDALEAWIADREGGGVPQGEG